jgi:hypothetical protein
MSTPEYWAVRLPVSQYYPEYMKKHHLAAIYDVYIYDITTGTHCCEGPLSYELIGVDTVYEFESGYEAPQAEVDEVEEYLNSVDPSDAYVHCFVINRCEQRKLNIDLDPEDTEEQWRDAAVDAYKANPLF